MEHKWKEEKIKESHISINKKILLTSFVFMFLIISSFIIRDQYDSLIRSVDIIYEGNLLLVYGGFGTVAFFSLITFLKNYSLALYNLVKFKKLREKVNKHLQYLIAKNGSENLGVIYTAYGKSKEEVFNAMSCLLEEAFSHSSTYGAKVILGIALDKGNIGTYQQKMVNKIYHQIGQKHPNVKVFLKCFLQDGSGKRTAIVDARNYVMKSGGAKNYIFMDGDTCIPKHTFIKLLPFLWLDNKLGGLTCNNKTYFQGTTWGLAWSKNRFIHRHCDCLAVLLVLTGRLSIIKGSVVESEEFDILLLNHYVRTKDGQVVKMLSGDDKTIYVLLLKLGLKTLYVPDVSVLCMETLPDNEKGLKNNWVYNSSKLSYRYSGNMIAVGKDLLDKFTFKELGLWRAWKIVDQRYGYWRPMSSFIAALTLSCLYHWIFFLIYLNYALVKSTIETLLIGALYGEWNFYLPVVKRITDLSNSFIKNDKLSNLNKQNWNNQGIKSGKYKKNHFFPIVRIMGITWGVWFLLGLF